MKTALIILAAVFVLIVLYQLYTDSKIRYEANKKMYDDFYQEIEKDVDTLKINEKNYLKIKDSLIRLSKMTHEDIGSTTDLATKFVRRFKG